MPRRKWDCPKRQVYWPLYEALGREIRKKRKENKLTQTALAKLIGKSHQMIVSVENGTCLPSISTLYEIADALFCSPRDLLPEMDSIQSGEQK